MRHNCENTLTADRVLNAIFVYYSAVFLNRISFLKNKKIKL